jgi:hypothetical protein
MMWETTVGMEGVAPPLSPLLIDLEEEPLDVILKKAKGAGHIRGVIPHLILGEVTQLQFVDDTIIMIQL